MSRTGAPWWTADVADERPGFSPKRCRQENGDEKVDQTSFSTLHGQLADGGENDEVSNGEVPEKGDSSEKSTKPADIRNVEESPEVEDNDEEQPPTRPRHSHVLPGQIEEGLGNMSLHEVVERRLFSSIYRTREDANRVNELGETPLHFAAEIGAASIVALLIGKGADPNVVDNDGFTPLILAANYGHAAVAEILLKSGADPNSQYGYAMAPLHFAAHGGFTDVVRVLLRYGADPTRPDASGDLPSDYAHHGGHFKLALSLLVVSGGHPRQHCTVRR